MKRSSRQLQEKRPGPEAALKMNIFWERAAKPGSQQVLAHVETLTWVWDIHPELVWQE